MPSSLLELRVLEGPNLYFPRAAIKLTLDVSGLVDAVVTDYMMPRMNGAALAERIDKRFPDLPVMIVTGYSGGDLELKVPQLAKPFRQADLAAALNRLVELDDGKVVPFKRSG